MQKVWITFKVIEAVLSLTCLGFHIKGILNHEEPLPHRVIFCGTFCFFAMNSIFGIMRVALGGGMALFMETSVSIFGSFCFIICSIMAMFYAEADEHLMYLSDLEEAAHPFFRISKIQSIVSLVTGVTFLLHGIFATDVLVMTTVSKAPSGRLSTFFFSEGDESNQPLRLHLFFQPLLPYFICQCCINNRLCARCAQELEDEPSIPIHRAESFMLDSDVIRVVSAQRSKAKEEETNPKKDDQSDKSVVVNMPPQ